MESIQKTHLNGEKEKEENTKIKKQCHKYEWPPKDKGC